MIVVDTNLIAYLHIAGERTPQAQRALRQDPEWAAPLLWRSEFRNVLALYLRQQVFSLDDAQAIMQQAESLLPGREYEVSRGAYWRVSGLPAVQPMTVNLWC